MNKTIKKCLVLIPMVALLGACSDGSIDIEEAQKRAKEITSWREKEEFSYQLVYTLTYDLSLTQSNYVQNEKHKVIKDNKDAHYFYIYHSFILFFFPPLFII